ncbi:hypothetical protein, partial [Ureaplasma diversum]|uniref:hypothetical protein n=1 Tax=Ureaplasma diversum TaxID=42094 RepID=UPI0005715863
AVACNNETNDPDTQKQNEPNNSNKNNNNNNAKNNTLQSVNQKKLDHLRVENYETILNNAKTYDDRETIKDSKDLIFQFANPKETLVRKDGYYEMTFNLANGENKNVAVVLGPRTGAVNASNTINSTLTKITGEEGVVQFRNLSADKEYKVIGLIVLNNDKNIDKVINVQIPTKANRVSKKAADDAWEESQEEAHSHAPSVSATITTDAKIGDKFLKQTSVDIPTPEHAFREVKDGNFVLTYSLTYRNNLWTKAYIIEDGETDESKVLASDVVWIGKTIANAMFKGVNPNKKYRLHKIEIFEKQDAEQLVQTIPSDQLKSLGTVERNKNLGNPNVSGIVINNAERLLYNWSNSQAARLELRIRLKNPKNFIGKRITARLATSPRENLKTKLDDLGGIVYSDVEYGNDYVDKYGIAHLHFSTYIRWKKDYFLELFEIYRRKAEDGDQESEANTDKGSLAFDNYLHQQVRTPPHKLDGFDNTATLVVDPNDDIFDNDRNTKKTVKFENLGPLTFDRTVWNYSKKLANVPEDAFYDPVAGIGQPRHYYGNVRIIHDTNNPSLTAIDNLEEDTYIEITLKDRSNGKIVRSKKALITKNGKAHVVFAYVDSPDPEMPNDWVELAHEYDIEEIKFYRAVQKENSEYEEYDYHELKNIEINIPSDRHITTKI